MEALNSSSQLVARSLDLLKECIDMGEYTWVKTPEFDSAIEKLEEALEKLTGKM
jgi:hypothetical protein